MTISSGMVIKLRKKTRVAIRRNIKEFCSKFSGQIQQAIKTLHQINYETGDKLPNIFQGEDISYDCVYSIDRKHVLIIFKQDKKKSFDFNLVNGDIFNYLDKTGIWAHSPVAFKLNNCSEVNIKRCKIQGMKPFEIDGDNIELVIDKLEIELWKRSTPRREGL